MLGMSVPFFYFDELQPLVDFLIYRISDADEEGISFLKSQATKPIWLVAEPNDLAKPETRELLASLQDLLEVVIYDPQDITEPQPLAEAHRWIEIVTEGRASIYLQWNGRRKNQPVWLFDRLAIPHDLARGFIINRDKLDSRQLHYSELSSLDELRRLPPASLATNAPLAAALRGVDLSKRERRPKLLKTAYATDIRATSGVLNLAVSNLKAIREALNYES